MPKIRTVFRPWEEVDVDDAEAAAMARMGLLAPEAAAAAPEVLEPEPEPAPASKPRRGKTTDPAPAEEVNTDGSSEEGGQAEEG